MQCIRITFYEIRMKVKVEESYINHLEIDTKIKYIFPRLSHNYLRCNVAVCDVMLLPLIPIKTLYSLRPKLRVIYENFETNLN